MHYYVFPQIFSIPYQVDWLLSGDKTSRDDHIDSLIYTSITSTLVIWFKSNDAVQHEGFSFTYEEGNELSNK